MSVAAITSKGQITIPKDVRDRLGLRKGDRVEFKISKNNTAILVPRTTRTDDVFGMLSRYAKGKTISVEDMDRGIAEGFRRGKL